MTDPLPLWSSNLYSYSLNNPVTLYDLDGASFSMPGLGGFVRTARSVAIGVMNTASAVSQTLLQPFNTLGQAQVAGINAGAQAFVQNASTIDRFAGSTASILSGLSLAAAPFPAVSKALTVGSLVAQNGSSPESVRAPVLTRVS